MNKLNTTTSGTKMNLSGKQTEADAASHAT